MLRMLITAVLGVTLLAGAGGTSAATTGPFPPRPAFWETPLADPSVVRDGATWFAVGTGWRGGTASSGSESSGWAAGSPLLDSRPAWARNGDVWAPEVERAPDGTWLAYYSIPVSGLPRPEDRCIGVATSPGLGVPFTPDHAAPVVCPPSALAPPASDAPAPAEGLPLAGMIDPSSYISPDGRRWLLYRTQGEPSSIRMVRLDASGRRAIRPSVELLRDPGVLENPVMVDQGGWRYLLLSRGDFGGCRYRTVWRRSRSLQKGWDSADETTLTNRMNTGICGPGGADYVPPADGRPNRIFLHGWVCDGTNGPCPDSYSSHTDGSHADGTRRGQRVPYVARLRWTRRGPQLAQFIQGPGWTPPPSPWQ